MKKNHVLLDLDVFSKFDSSENSEIDILVKILVYFKEVFELLLELMITFRAIKKSLIFFAIKD